MESSQLIWIVGPAIGLVGMMAGGFWGVGCGWIVVPTMLILGFDPFDAVGIGLLQMVPSMLPTVIRQSPEIGWCKGEPGRVLVLPLAAGSILASLSGKLINEKLFAFFGTPDVLSWMLTGVILIIGLQTLLTRTRVAASEFPVITPAGRAGIFAAGIVTGALSSMLGIGGGLLMRPLMSSCFRIPEYYTSRVVRLLVVLTASVGGATYLFRSGGTATTVLLGAALVAAGGMAGFPVGVRMHRIAFNAGYAQSIHKSFAVVALAMLLNTLLNLAGWREASRIVMLLIGCGVGAGLILFTFYVRKHPKTYSAG